MKLKRPTKRKKYATGTSVKNYIENPATTLAQNDIDLAESAYIAETNPLTNILKVLGQTTMQLGASQAGVAGEFIVGADTILDQFEGGGTVGNNQRVRDIRPFSMSNGKGKSPSTVVMQSIGFGDKFYATPTIFPKEGNTGSSNPNDWLQLEGREAYDEAKLRGELFEFNSDIEAQKFAKGSWKTNSAQTRAERNQELPEFELGGQVSRRGANIEVEGGEVAETPDGELLEFKGASHANGGIDVDNVPEGTDIYSKKVKIGGESMADRKKSREAKKTSLLKLIEKSDGMDRVLTKTYERMEKNLQDEDDFDMQVQEQLTAAVDNNKPQFKYGGRVKYPGGVYNLGIENDSFGIDGFEKFNPFTPNFDVTQFGGFGDGMPKSSEGDFAFKYEGVDAPYTIPEDALGNAPSSKVDGGGGGFMSGAGGSGTVGDVMGMIGKGLGAIQPRKDVLRNRATDTPNINPYADFGEDALEKISEGQNLVNQNLAEYLKSIELSKQGAIRKGRNTARSVNTMRALDINTEMAFQGQEGKARIGATNQLLDLITKEAQLENVQDQYQMRGEGFRDAADRADKDVFQTELSKANQAMFEGITDTGKSLNQIKSRERNMEIVAELQKLGFDQNQIRMILGLAEQSTTETSAAIGK